MFSSPALTANAFLWKIIVFLWPWYWFVIVVILIVWVIWEIQTRNGTAHYNSRNGFSPTFNRFVGSGSYFGIQALLYLLFNKLFGEMVYCYIWPFPVHAVVFISTGLMLHISGFWPYLKEPGSRRWYKKFSSRTRY
jgi:hypothetical protein